jgi:interferon gamma-inducible protein 30
MAAFYAFALLMLIGAPISSYGQANLKVSVKLYYEVGCPFCLKFVTDILNPLLQIPGVLENVMDFEGFPFGNAYYVTPFCGGGAGYTMNDRKCFESHCGPTVPAPPAECFAGTMICQHGESECKLNRAAACVKDISKDPKTYMQVSECMGKGAGPVIYSHKEAELIAKCSAQYGFAAWSTTGVNCWNSVGAPAGDALLKQQAHATPVHPAVPYVTVNGLEVDSKVFLSTLCKTYGGTPVPAFTAVCTNGLPAAAPALLL